MTDKSDSPKKPRAKRKGSPSGDNYELSGDFRGAVVNIKSTIVSNAEVKDLEGLPPEAGEAPFQGLQYFDEKDADRFFGRETLVAKIVGRLAASRFLTVIGASGSGKSSVVRAGVIPALRRGERLADGSLPPTDSGQWDVRILTPSAHPLEALAANLTRDSESVSAIAALRADLVQDPNSLSPQGQKDGDRLRIGRVNCVKQIFDESPSFVILAALRKNFLELIDDQQQMFLIILSQHAVRNQAERIWVLYEVRA